jgi:hypothetical protein
MSFANKGSTIPLGHEASGGGILTLGPALALAGGLLILRLVVSYFSSPLRSIPGPFLAKFTDAWRALDYWKTTQIQSHRELHARHGAAVRIGPNMVSLNDPSLLKKIYDTRGNYVKVNLPLHALLCRPTPCLSAPLFVSKLSVVVEYAVEKMPVASQVANSPSRVTSTRSATPRTRASASRTSSARAATTSTRGTSSRTRSTSTCRPSSASSTCWTTWSSTCARSWTSGSSRARMPARRLTWPTGSSLVRPRS